MPNLCERKLNHKLDQTDVRDRLKASPAVALPSKAQVSHWQPIMDQGQTGSCAGHAMAWMWAQVLESRGMRIDLTLSPWYIYYFARLLDGSVVEDEGVTSRSALKAVNHYGAAPLDLWPQSKPLNAHPDEAATIYGQALTIPKYAKCENLQDIKYSIAIENQSVFLGVPVFPNWDDDHGGMIPWVPGFAIGGHAIPAIGFDDDLVIGQSKGAIQLANSWSTKWGANGIFWLPYDFFLNNRVDAWAIDFNAIPDAA